MTEIKPQPLAIEEILKGERNYIIPMYQRNFAWGEGEIKQLVQDVMDCYLKKSVRYFIGTLIVFERNDGKLEVIDGQQRLTTLVLLACYLKNEQNHDTPGLRLCISYESRKYSGDVFEEIFKGSDLTRFDSDGDRNNAVLDRYKLIDGILTGTFRENDLEDKNEQRRFYGYLFSKVIVTQVEVPKHTDLNHYFEVMNNRGEQLEKHEILKSRMMKKLVNQEERECFAKIWGACENMEKYLQIGFSEKQRDKLFGKDSWNSLVVYNFSELCQALEISKRGYAENCQGQMIVEIVENEEEGDKNGKEEQQQDDGNKERFNSVVNFPNFLLHVLRIQMIQTKNGDVTLDDRNKDIPLDDTNLISAFEKEILKLDNDQSVKKVKQFAFYLFKCKFLYDSHIIKREIQSGEWSLKRIKKEDGQISYVNTFGADKDIDDDVNRKILMLLSMFHVSSPAFANKQWLNAALHYLFKNHPIAGAAYLDQLESIAKSFLFDRILSLNHSLSYFEIIFVNEGKCQTKEENKGIIKEKMKRKLSYGNIENFVFNFLEYILWKKYIAEKKVERFRFTFRSSKEHYFPQSPRSGEKLDSDPDQHQELLNDFGNLYLISPSENSQLGNSMPPVKREIHREKHDKQNGVNSIKLHKMMESNERWDATSIVKHREEMEDDILGEL